MELELLITELDQTTIQLDKINFLATEKTIMAYKQIVEMMDQRGTYFTGDEVITDVRAEEILQELKQRQGGNEV